MAGGREGGRGVDLEEDGARVIKSPIILRRKWGGSPRGREGGDDAFVVALGGAKMSRA